MLRIVLMMWLAGTGAVWAQSCPPAPAGAKPGWFAEVHQWDAKVGGMMPDAAVNASAIRGFPIKFGQINGLAGSGVTHKVVFNGNFRACEAGRYEFTFLIEGGSSDRRRAMLCVGELNQGSNKLFSIGNQRMFEMVAPGITKPYNGYIDLNAGWHPLQMIIGCGVQKYGGKTSIFREPPPPVLFDTIIALRVRGPNDMQPRDFQPGEIVQRGR